MENFQMAAWLYRNLIMWVFQVTGGKTDYLMNGFLGQLIIYMDNNN